MEEVKMEDLPNEVKEAVRKQFAGNLKFAALLELRKRALQRGEYMKAVQYGNQIQAMEDLFAKHYMNACVEESVAIQEFMKDVPEEERITMRGYTYLVLMVIDMLDSVVEDINQVLDEHSKGSKVKMFDNVKKLGKEAKATLMSFNSQFLKKDKFFTNLYGDTADNMYKMSLNKAISFVKKIDKHEEGVNKKAKHNAKMAQGC